MEFLTEKATERPTKAPVHFRVYEVGNDSFVFCPVRNRAYKVNGKSEEIVRQWWLYRLKELYGYSFDQMSVEVPIKVGSAEAKKAADIVVYTTATKNQPRIFVEVKKPNRKDGID
ncbi:type I restriction enzyme HsdR N-terminal domain-containing protein [Bradyrhizobium murdochi]|uniref:type I restriction enzyme HsdR N-terminal domain-containing protein n=1 Tax=Bradyrhizobium murdochi TaxID=1038859 RepID=UPI0003F89AB4|nr:type I restriction enzyme HsdR N-terminal domain-containing protein [Bradyrhizobium murdochi]